MPLGSLRSLPPESQNAVQVPVYWVGIQLEEFPCSLVTSDEPSQQKLFSQIGVFRGKLHYSLLRMVRQEFGAFYVFLLLTRLIY